MAAGLTALFREIIGPRENMTPTLADTAVEPSRHKCLIYDGHPSEQLPVVVPFLRDGLQTNWRCLYIGSPEMVRMVDLALAIHGVNPAREIDRGSLILSSERSLASDGSFEPKRMIEALSAEVDRAVSGGYEGLCATGDMLWELGSAENFDSLLEYEALLEQAFRRMPLRGICQYQRELVPEHALNHALTTHRGVYINADLNQDNLFYMPPELLLQNQDDASAAKQQGEWMCQQIIRILNAEKRRDEALKALQQSEAEQRYLARQLAEANRTLEHRVKERTAELETANHHLEAFSYSVSHDLRSPLQSILGFSDILTEEFGHTLGSKGLQHVRRVQEGAERMSELISGLLALSGVVGAELRRERIDLTALAHEVIREIREMESSRPAEIVIHPNMRAFGDRVLLRSALANLLGNAWKFTAKCSRARIEVGHKTDEAGQPAYFVVDNGAGFDMLRAEKLFTAFERLHKQEEFRGTGIGLATVQRIIARHGGRIWAEAKPDQGATFFFTLSPEPQPAGVIH